MAYEVRLINSDELKLANDLFKVVYKKHRTESQFQWEFVDGPCGPAIYVGAFDKDRLIGTQAAIPLYFIDGDGNRVLTAKSEDTLLDPEYRGKGLFDRMYEVLIDECRKRGIVSIWGFTYAKKPFLKQGFEIPFVTNNGIFVINPLKSYEYLCGLNPNNRFKEKLQIGALVLFSFMKALFKSIGQNFKVTKVEVEEISSALNDELSGSSFQILDQDKDYLKWRIKDNPFSNSYSLLRVNDRDNNLIATVLINVRQHGLAYIEQLFFTKSATFYLRVKAVRSTLAFIKSKSAFVVRHWGMTLNYSNLQEIKTLSSAGFIYSGRGTSFVYLRLDKDKAINPNRLIVSRLYTQGNI